MTRFIADWECKRLVPQLNWLGSMVQGRGRKRPCHLLLSKNLCAPSSMFLLDAAAAAARQAHGRGMVEAKQSAAP